MYESMSLLAVDCPCTNGEGLNSGSNLSDGIYLCPFWLLIVQTLLTNLVEMICTVLKLLGLYSCH
jgi:hypothetical protein